MTKIKWSAQMSDEDFVLASKLYFGQRFWDLHIGCCLIAKIDPDTKKSPVGRDYLDWTEEDEDEYDFTKRPFIVAMRAISERDQGQLKFTNTAPLNVTERKDVIATGKDVKIDTRVFVRWVLEQWPEGCSHFNQAETAYQKRKLAKKEQIAKNQGKQQLKKWGPSSLVQKAQVEKAFWKMVTDQKLDVNKSKGRVSQWARDLVSIMSETISEPYKFHTVRAWISFWIEENQPIIEISKTKSK